MLNFYIRLYELILSRRYRIKLKGIEILQEKTPKLILPNHVSHIDPQILSIIIHNHTDFVPLAAERFFNTPVVKYFLKHLHAVRVPDFKKNMRDGNLLHNINAQIIGALINNKSAMIFPAGQLSYGGIERIYNKQSAYSVVTNLPENIKIVGVRVRGLWGSMWSKAWNGKRPVFLSTFLFAILYYFANFIFFCPKRTVNIEFVDITKETLEASKSDRKTFNLFLEDFYNAPGPDPAVFVRHLFYFPRIKNKVTPQPV